MVSDEEFRALQERVDRLERVVPGIDADVSALQAQRRADLELLMALRGTQLEQQQQIAELRSELRTGFDQMRAGFETLVGMLQRLEGPSDG